MQRVLSIIGTRPEAIKMAPVIQALRNHPDRIDSRVCVTGQHREMLDQMLTTFDLPVDIHLDVMQRDQQLAELTAVLLTRLAAVVEEIRPHWILAQGDTTTVLAAALAAYYHHVQFGHVEAGLRTGDLNHPFPEEANRRIADGLAALLFTPTDHSRRLLLSEGIPDARILVTGNTIVDALLSLAQRPYDWAAGPLASVPQDKRIVLITAHRRESFGAPLRDVCLAISDLAERFGSAGVQFVYPVHLNPNVQRPVHEILAGVPSVSLIAPQDYVSMVNLLKRSTLVLTDSGGVQEEAPTFGVPVLVMREVTERPEGVHAGVSRVVGRERATIVSAVSRLLEDADAHAAMVTTHNPYGDGRAAARIVSALMERDLDVLVSAADAAVHS